jgi:hypothetical protein
VGLLVDEGKIDLDEKIAKFFPEKIDTELPKYLAEQTVRETLTMTTAGQCKSWFKVEDPDRSHIYFAPRDKYRPAGTVWDYDSAGSQLLTHLVEKVSGKNLFDYMNEKHVNAGIKTYFGKKFKLTSKQAADFKYLCAGDFKIAKRKMDVLENGVYTNDKIYEYLLAEQKEKDIKTSTPLDV